MGYYEALEAAGAVVHTYESFGDYQGTWFADVTYNGERGIVRGSYGSCSGCDSFQAEFDWAAEQCDTHRYVSAVESCADCDEHRDSYTTRLAAFGHTYLPPRPAAELLEYYEKNDWYSDGNDIKDFLCSCKTLHESL